MGKEESRRNFVSELAAEIHKDFLSFQCTKKCNIFQQIAQTSFVDKNWRILT